MQIKIISFDLFDFEIVLLKFVYNDKCVIFVFNAINQITLQKHFETWYLKRLLFI